MGLQFMNDFYLENSNNIVSFEGDAFGPYNPEEYAHTTNQSSYSLYWYWDVAVAAWLTPDDCLPETSCSNPFTTGIDRSKKTGKYSIRLVLKKEKSHREVPKL